MLISNNIKINNVIKSKNKETCSLDWYMSIEFCIQSLLPAKQLINICDGRICKIKII